MKLVVFLLVLRFLNILANGTNVTTKQVVQRHLSTEQRLYNYLFTEGYNRDLRPAINASAITNITIDSNIASITELNEAEETVTFSQWMRVWYTDDYLSWDIADFDNYTQIIVPYSKVWPHDITIMEKLARLDTVRVVDDEATRVVITHEGSVRITWAEVVTVHCPFSVNEFPFDSQNCTLTFLSWAYDASQVFLNPKTNISSMNNQNPEWDFVSYTATPILSEYTIGDWWEIKYHLVLNRKPLYYVITQLLPSWAITSLAILGVFSPFSANQERQERCSMGLTALLTMSVILLTVSDYMPKNPSQFPTLGKFILYEMGMTCAATMGGVVVMYFHSIMAFGNTPSKWLLIITGLEYQTRGQVVRLSQTMVSKGSQAEPDGILFGKSSKSRSSVSTTSTSLSSACPSELITDVTRVRTMVSDIKQMLVDRERALDLERVWVRICYRLDIAFLLVFFISNCIICFTFISPLFF